MYNMTTAVPHLSGLSRRLVQDKVISEEQAREALLESNASGEAIIQYLVKRNIASASDIALIASD
jgi:hypothetical protein